MLNPAERGLGAWLRVMGYRFAMILCGDVSLIWTDAVQGGGWSWPVVSQRSGWQDLLGFAPVVIALAVGVVNKVIGLWLTIVTAQQPRAVFVTDSGG